VEAAKGTRNPLARNRETPEEGAFRTLAFTNPLAQGTFNVYVPRNGRPSKKKNHSKTKQRKLFKKKHKNAGAPEKLVSKKGDRDQAEAGVVSRGEI